MSTGFNMKRFRLASLHPARLGSAATATWAHLSRRCELRLSTKYSSGLQVMSRVDVEPYEIAEDHWEFNEHLCGDGPIQEYPWNGVDHISEPPFYGHRGKSFDV